MYLICLTIEIIIVTQCITLVIGPLIAWIGKRFVQQGDLSGIEERIFIEPKRQRKYKQLHPDAHMLAKNVVLLRMIKPSPNLMNHVLYRVLEFLILLNTNFQYSNGG